MFAEACVVDASSGFGTVVTVNVVVEVDVGLRPGGTGLHLWHPPVSVVIGGHCSTARAGD